MTGVSGWSIRYLVASGDEHRWLPAWSSGVRLPSAVQVVVQGDSVPALLRVPLTVTLTTGS
jgi:hypothetical protein